MTAIFFPFFFMGCFGSRTWTIKSNIEAEIIRINPEVGGVQPMGKTPLVLKDIDGVHIYRIRRPGYKAETIILAESQKLDGEITINLDAIGDQKKVHLGLGRRLDLLLKAHRAFLRGNLEDAEETLRQIERSSGSDFGALVLKGNIAAIKGEAEKAVNYFRMAQAIYPEFKWSDKSK